MEAIELGLQIFSGVFMTLATAICLHDALLRNSWEKARLAAIEAEEAAEATRAAEDAASLESESDCECDCETENERETMDSNTKTVEDGWDDLSLDGSEWMNDFDDDYYQSGEDEHTLEGLPDGEDWLAINLDGHNDGKVGSQQETPDAKPSEQIKKRNRPATEPTEPKRPRITTREPVVARTSRQPKEPQAGDIPPTGPVKADIITQTARKVNEKNEAAKMKILEGERLGEFGPAVQYREICRIGRMLARSADAEKMALLRLCREAAQARYRSRDGNREQWLDCILFCDQIKRRCPQL